MSQSASQAHAFYRDVARDRRLWTIRDAGGYPAPMNPDGLRAMPFWSTLSRAQRIIERVPAYQGFEPVELSWRDFRDVWVPDLIRQGQLVGVNWSGPRAVGYDLEPEDVLRRIELASSADPR